MIRGPDPLAVTLTPVEAAALAKCLARHTTPQQLARRVEIVVQAGAGRSNAGISRALGVSEAMVRRWRQRWVGLQHVPLAEMSVEDRLQDQARSGAPAKFSAEQMAGLIAIACEDPSASGYPVSHWTPRELALEAVKRRLVTTISARQVGRFLKRGRLEAASQPLLVEHHRERSGRV